MRNPFRRGEKALTASAAVVEMAREGSLNTYIRLGGVNQQVNAAFMQAQSASYAFMYRTQPSVRRVIDYLALNISQLGLKLYERKSDTEREEVGNHAAALTMRYPNSFTPGTPFVQQAISDFLVHDNAYALKFRASPRDPLALLLIPPPSVGVLGAARYTIEAYRIFRSDGSYFDVAPEDVIHWRGYNPEDPRIGVSKLETLRQQLTEEATTQSATIELMKSGLARPGHIRRPLEAPVWSEQGRKRFEESWANRAKGSTRKTPVLEEGMTFEEGSVTPKDAEMLSGRQFTREEVAAQYGMVHCPPQGEEERAQLYADVLPPITESFAAWLGLGLLQAEFGETDLYFEFDLDEKLMGNDRLKALVSASGGPVLTRNEARAMVNKPAIKGADELITPLNVITGDNPKPSPMTMGPQDPNANPQDGSHREDQKSLLPRRAAQVERRNSYAAQFQDLLERFYSRQATARAKSVNGKASDWDRWDAELTADLEKLLRSVVGREGNIAAHRLGLQSFDAAQTLHYLRAVAEGNARDINAVTKRELQDGDPAEVFARARDVRAPVAGMSMASGAAYFAHVEAARQTPNAAQRTKTWVVNSANSRHPELDGETVAVEQDFSAGIVPGELPGCECTVEVS